MSFNPIAQGTTFPNAEDIKSAMLMARSGSADYLIAQVEKLAAQSKYLKSHPEIKNTITQGVRSYAEKLSAQSLSDPWSGHARQNKVFKRAQEFEVEIAANALAQPIDNVKIHYAVSTDGNYVRGYSTDNQETSVEQTTYLDNCFKDWLAGKDYGIVDGYLYKVNGKSIDETQKADADTVIHLIEEGGFDNYMSSRGVSDFSTVRRNYPGEALDATVEAQAVVETNNEDVQAGMSTRGG